MIGLIACTANRFSHFDILFCYLSNLIDASFESISLKPENYIVLKASRLLGFAVTNNNSHRFNRVYLVKRTF